MGVLCLMACMQTVFLGRAGAAVTTISCGQSVSTDVVLSADVGPCPGAGFTVRSALNVTIDLNGHKVIGPANLTAVIGIRVVVSDGVTIKGGTVTGFGYGIQLDASPRTTITQMQVTGNTGGLIGTPPNLAHVGTGITAALSPETVIRSNVVAGNGPTAGILVREAHGFLIEQNVVRNNAVRAITTFSHPNVPVQVTVGIYVVAGGGGRIDNNRHVIRNNQVLENGWHGIRIDGFTRDNVLANNQVHRNGLDQPINDRIFSFGDGILVAALGNTLTGNVVTGNGKNGIEVGHRENRIKGNVALLNARSPNTFAAHDLHDRITDCDGNEWSGNRYGTFNQACVTA